MGLSAAFDFEGASGTLVEIIEDSGTVLIELGREGSVVSHGFALRIVCSEARLVTLIVQNAWRSPYAKGWKGYRSYYQDQAGQWLQVENAHYDGKQYTVSVRLSLGSTTLAWYPLYPSSRLSKFIEGDQAAHNPSRPISGITQLQLGSADRPTVLIVARQHPGESMASYCLEGLLTKASRLLAHELQAHYVIFPLLNIEGLKSGYHRLDLSGLDMNRAWDRNDSAPVAQVQKAMKALGRIALVVDVHGDEVSKTSFYVQNGSSALWPFDMHDSPCADVLALRQPGKMRRLVRELVRSGRLTIRQGQTLAEYSWTHHDVPAVTLEISAHVADENAAFRIGGSLFTWIEGRVQGATSLRDPR